MEGEREWGGGCGGEVGAVGGAGGVCAGQLCVVYAYDGAAAEGLEGEGEVGGCGEVGGDWDKIEVLRFYRRTRLERYRATELAVPFSVPCYG